MYFIYFKITYNGDVTWKLEIKCSISIKYRQMSNKKIRRIVNLTSHMDFHSKWVF